jgi:hypothetical protein
VNHTHVQPENTKKEYAKLAGILIGLAITAGLASTAVGFGLDEWMRWFMGGFFIVFGSFKLIGYEMFINMFPDYDLLAKRSKIYTYFYPFIELFLGMLYIFNLAGIYRDSFTLIIMTIGALGVAKKLKDSGPIMCACLGNVIKLPLSTVTLLEDVVMAAMAFMLLVERFIF